MPSFRADLVMPATPSPNATESSPKAFALQELTACWDQGYEALARGDLDQLSALMDIAADHVVTAGNGAGDTTIEQSLRQQALAARGRLEHGMRAGLQGLQDEMATARIGHKALRGYQRPAAPTSNLVRDV
jgi:hypothetical protein